jgi:hypothetical protein
MNQYRCETCNFRSTDTPYYCKVNKNRHIDGFAHVQIMETGCASHSDFQTQREKVLDELDARIDEEIGTLEDSIPEMDINDAWEAKEKLPGLRHVFGITKGLRQAGEP